MKTINIEDLIVGGQYKITFVNGNWKPTWVTLVSINEYEASPWYNFRKRSPNEYRLPACKLYEFVGVEDRKTWSFYDLNWNKTWIAYRMGETND